MYNLFSLLLSIVLTLFLYFFIGSRSLPWPTKLFYSTSSITLLLIWNYPPPQPKFFPIVFSDNALYLYFCQVVTLALFYIISCKSLRFTCPAKMLPALSSQELYISKRPRFVYNYLLGSVLLCALSLIIKLSINDWSLLNIVSGQSESSNLLLLLISRYSGLFALALIITVTPFCNTLCKILLLGLTIASQLGVSRYTIAMSAMIVAFQSFRVISLRKQILILLVTLASILLSPSLFLYRSYFHSSKLIGELSFVDYVEAYFSSSSSLSILELYISSPRLQSAIFSVQKPLFDIFSSFESIFAALISPLPIGTDLRSWLYPTLSNTYNDIIYGGGVYDQILSIQSELFYHFGILGIFAMSLLMYLNLLLIRSSVVGARSAGIFLLPFPFLSIAAISQHVFYFVIPLLFLLGRCRTRPTQYTSTA